jgi:hypothetical protein
MYLGFALCVVGVIGLYYYAFMREPEVWVFIVAMLLVVGGGGIMRGASGWRGFVIGGKPWTPDDHKKNR